MLKIKNTTKRGKALLQKAKNWEGVNLNEVYSSCSYEKQKAWQDCYNKMLEEGGSCFHIFSHNTFNFSVAWLVSDGVRIETFQNSYYIYEAREPFVV